MSKLVVDLLVDLCQKPARGFCEVETGADGGAEDGGEKGGGHAFAHDVGNDD